MDRPSFALLAFTVLFGCGTGTGGAGGDAGTGTGGTASSASSASGTSTSTSTSSGGGCAPDCEQQGFTCCAGVCVNTKNDFHNCGACGHVCPADPPFCSNGACTAPMCTLGVGTCKGDVCCGNVCCAAGTICCDIQGPGPTTGPKCAPPENGTCPLGCPLCK